MGVIQRQGLWNMVITYVGVAIGFVSLIFLQPNLLTPSELGLTRVLISFSSFIATVLPLGVSNINVRYFPFFRDAGTKHHGYFGLMLLFPLTGSLIGSGIIWLCQDYIISIYQKESPLFATYFSSVLPLAIIIAFLVALNSYAWALFKTTVPSFLSDVLNRILFIAVIALYFFEIITLDQFILAFVGTYAIQLLILLIYIMSIDRPGWRIDMEFLRTRDVRMMARYGLLLMITSFSSVSLKYLDSIMIARFMPLAFVGVYSIAAFIATIIETPLFSMERIATAKIAHAWSVNDHSEIKKIYHLSSRYMSLLGGILLLGVCINADDLLSLLPQDYHAGVTVTYIMSASAFINMATGVNYSILFNSPKYIYGVSFIALLLVLTIVGNFMLIPLFGIEGAALATALAGVVYNILKYFYIWYEFKMQPFDLSTLKILFAMALVLGAGLAFPDLGNPFTTIAVRSAVITLIYGGLIYVLRAAPELHKFIGLGEKR